MFKRWRQAFFETGSNFAIATPLPVVFLLPPAILYFQPNSCNSKTPAFHKVPYQDVYLPVDGGVIHGWWMPANKPKLGTLLYLHGKGFNIGANVTQAYRFRKLGFSVLLIDYRGYGKSKGNFPTESQIYEDAETAWNYLVKQRKIPANQIFIYGHSLGGAVAIDLAVKHPEAAGLIVHNSFTSMHNMVERYPYFRIFPISLILNNRFDSITKVKSLKMPVLFIHGTADPFISHTMSKSLYAAAPKPKQLLLISGAKHNNGDLFFNNFQYRREIQNFAKSARKCLH